MPDGSWVKLSPTRKERVRLAKASIRKFKDELVLSGYDPKKIEALLRAKGMSPQGIMQQEIKYTMAEDTIAKMAGKTTPAELEACKHDAKYSVLRPKTVGEVTNEDE